MGREYIVSRPSAVAHLQSLGYEPLRTETDGTSENRIHWVFSYSEGVAGAVKTYTRHLLNRLADIDKQKEERWESTTTHEA